MLSTRWSFIPFLFIFQVAIFNLFRIPFAFQNNFEVQFLAESIFSSLWVDATVAAWLCIPITLLQVFALLLPHQTWPLGLFRWYWSLVVVAICLIEATSIQTYKVMGISFTPTLLAYFSSPGPIFSVLGKFISWQYLGLTLIMTFFALLPVFIIGWSTSGQQRFKVVFFSYSATYLALLGGLAIGIEKHIPGLEMPQTFSANLITANYAALNKTMAFVAPLTNQSLAAAQTNKVNEDFSSINGIINQKPITPRFSVNKPNIVVIVLKGWTNDIVESLGGEKLVAHYLTKNSKTGLMFPNFMATGTSQDQGLLALFNGLPAIGNTNYFASKNVSKSHTSLFRSFSAHGYYTSLFHGSDPLFSAYTSSLGPDDLNVLHTQTSLKSKMPKTTWGMTDGDLLNYMADSLSSQKEPFFTTILTSSPMPPFSILEKPYFEAITHGNMYRSAVTYSDGSIHDFLEKSKQQSWFKNTLFVFVSDGSNNYIDHHANADISRNKVPMIWWGNVLPANWSGKEVTSFCSQFDLPATLLGALGLSSEAYPLSSNILALNASNAHSFYTTESSVGWVSSLGSIVFPVLNPNTVYTTTGDSTATALLRKQATQFYLKAAELVEK